MQRVQEETMKPLPTATVTGTIENSLMALELVLNSDLVKLGTYEGRMKLQTGIDILSKMQRGVPPSAVLCAKSAFWKGFSDRCEWFLQFEAAKGKIERGRSAMP